MQGCGAAVKKTLCGHCHGSGMVKAMALPEGWQGEEFSTASYCSFGFQGQGLRLITGAFLNKKKILVKVHAEIYVF